LEGEFFMNRYSRQIILPEIGEEGQLKLSNAKVAVVGAGGLGSHVLYNLASAGVGNIKIIDPDVVDITNLNRQILHFESDVGREKSKSAKEKLQQYNREIKIEAVTALFDETQIAGFDVVLSCVDTKTTRYLLNSACVSKKIPFIDGGIQGFEGYVLTVLPGVTPCYNCIFPQIHESETAGVLGATAGVIGSMMAMEAIKLIVGIPITEHFHYVDLLSWRITPIMKERDVGCGVCNR